MVFLHNGLSSNGDGHTFSIMPHQNLSNRSRLNFWNVSAPAGTAVDVTGYPTRIGSLTAANWIVTIGFCMKQ